MNETYMFLTIKINYFQLWLLFKSDLYYSATEKWRKLSDLINFQTQK